MLLIKILEVPIFQSFMEFDEVIYVEVVREYTLSEICCIVVDGALNPEKSFKTAAKPLQNAWIFSIQEYSQVLNSFFEPDIPIDLVEHSQYNRKDPNTIV